MTEPAGPSTQDGIFYQNSVAATYLADLLSLHPSTPGQTVVSVRVEAPTHVDDIVVRYQDGHGEWIQAKSNLRRSGDAWRGLWQSFSKLFLEKSFAHNDQMKLVLGRRNSLAEALIALAEIAKTSDNDREWRARLATESADCLSSVEKYLSPTISPIELFRNVAVEVVTLADVEDSFKWKTLGTAAPPPSTLLTLLRDKVGGLARIRGTFRAANLRSQLAADAGLELFEPREWGLQAYRDTLRSLCRIELPGKGKSAHVDEIFVWPVATKMAAANDRDFEDETPRWDAPERNSTITLSEFPRGEIHRCVIVAGPGFGKSALLLAVCSNLLSTPITPVEVRLSDLGNSNYSIVEYLEKQVNKDYSVRIDWLRLAEQGLLAVLFDGLDEVPTERRQDLLKRLARFSARFADVPWLMTVRDPAVINGPVDAELIELHPLTNREIARFVSNFKRWSPELDEWNFTNSLSAYPDIARLARIPLFLSIMLSAWTADMAIPTSRSDLIETYLRTLFRRKDPSGEVVYGETRIRQLAQAIAFESLEREEIGLSDRQARAVLERWDVVETDVVLQRLTDDGVLRRGTSGRLQFPYPIIQEYLAALHLVEKHPEQVAARIGDVVKRPWAQVLQFALELLPNPSSIMRSMLAAPDDAFSTALRLVGRCVANGAAVDRDLEFEIGTKLAQLWRGAHYSMREKVGRLIIDKFAFPLHPKVREVMGKPWLLGSGTDEILNRALDPDLTLLVVDSLLEGRLKRFLSLRDIKLPLNAVGPAVAARVKDVSRRQGLELEEFETLGEFLHEIRFQEPCFDLDQIAEDAQLPLALRFAAYGARVEKPPSHAISLAKKALYDDHWPNRHACIDVLSRVADRLQVVQDILGDDSFPEQGKRNLLKDIWQIFPDRDELRKAADALSQMDAIKGHSRDVMLVLASRLGNADAYDELVSRLDTLDNDILHQTLNSLGTVGNSSAEELARSKLARRDFPPQDIPDIIGSVLTGLTNKIDGHGWDTFALEAVPLPSSFQSWMSIVDEWLDVKGLTTIQRLRAISRVLEYRPELIDEIKEIVFSIEDPDDDVWNNEDEHGHHLRGALDDVRRHRVVVPLEFAKKFALAERPNLMFAGIAAIAAHFSHEALDLLVSIYKSASHEDKGFVFEAIETLATRLGVVLSPQELTG